MHVGRSLAMFLLEFPAASVLALLFGQPGGECLDFPAAPGILRLTLFECRSAGRELLAALGTLFTVSLDFRTVRCNLAHLPIDFLSLPGALALLFVEFRGKRRDLLAVLLGLQGELPDLFLRFQETAPYQAFPGGGILFQSPQVGYRRFLRRQTAHSLKLPLCLVGHDGRLVVPAARVVDLREEGVAPVQAADFGRPPQIPGKHPGIEANHGPLPVPAIANVVQPPVMDGRQVQGVAIRHLPSAPREEAHGHFVGRADEKQRDHPQPGKAREDAAPKRP